jgi:uncharacterized protein (DUF58 family)
MSQQTGNILTPWQGPGAPANRPGGLKGLGLKIWSMIVPPRSQRFLPTGAGYLLIIVAIGLCISAYNTGSNILFVSLSLILSALLLSGVLSWVNFRRTRWRMLADPPFRAEKKGAVLVELRNDKRLLPTYSVWFRIKAPRSGGNDRLYLEQRLDPGRTARIKWMFEPKERGVEKVELGGAVSEFPFGFLRKSVGWPLSLEILVWPRRIAYEGRESMSTQELAMQGRSNKRVGQGDDLVNLRNYQRGDSHRLIHWKASAKARRLQVRQFTAENHSGYFFFLETAEALWRTEEQFDRFCRFVFTLAEDFFQSNRILGASIDEKPPVYFHRYVDLAGFFDQLATLRMTARDRHLKPPLHHNLVTFESNGGSGIIARCAGESIAAT